MALIAMRIADRSEIPPDGGTAVQENADRPVFKGTSGDDYACADCGNVLARSMAPEYMNRKVRIRCGRCGSINAAIEVPGVDYNKAFGRRREHYS
jgi:DNA-directed RNA polymerase subunit RPC12/RpoP